MTDLLFVIALCAPAIHPVTALSIVQHESGAKPYAIGINGKKGAKVKLTRQPATEHQAIALARALIGAGQSIDMGYAQINSRTAKKLGIPIEAIFRPCVNLSAMQRVLVADYARTQKTHPSPQRALQAALSRYNTGDATRGIRNGYVASVYRQATRAQRTIAPSEQ